MLIVTPEHLKAYSACPRRTQYSWDQIEPPTLSTEGKIVRSVIQASYLFAGRRGRIPTWRMMSTWAEKQLIQALPDLPPAHLYRDYKDVLTRLLSFRTKCLLGEFGDPGVINLPVALRLTEQLGFRDSVDIVQIGDKIRVFDFRETQGPAASLKAVSVFNDVSVQARLWGLWKCSETVPDEYVRLVISPGAIRPLRIRITEKTLQKSEEVIRHMLQGIRRDIFYPSFGIQCETCPFRPQCSY